MSGNKLIRFGGTLLFLALVVFGFYYFVVARKVASNPSGISAAGFSSGSGLSGELRSLAEANDEFLRQLESLQNISLQSDLFSSTIFNDRLIDSSFELNTEPRCRRNPFAPIGVTDDYNCLESTTVSPLPLEVASSTDVSSASSEENLDL